MADWIPCSTLKYVIFWHWKPYFLLYIFKQRRLVACGDKPFTANCRIKIPAMFRRRFGIFRGIPKLFTYFSPSSPPPAAACLRNAVTGTPLLPDVHSIVIAAADDLGQLILKLIMNNYELKGPGLESHAGRISLSATTSSVQGLPGSFLGTKRLN